MKSSPDRLVTRLLLAPTLMIAAAILVKGFAQVGDGFAAGAVAALGILLVYVAYGRRASERLLPVGGMVATAVAGLGVAFLVAFVPPLLGRPILSHFPGPGEAVVHVGTLEILTTVLFDLGIAMLVVGSVAGALAIIARFAERNDP
jgi:multisubunit Na+/H+ antiporter MnhB subunit